MLISGYFSFFHSIAIENIFGQSLLYFKGTYSCLETIYYKVFELSLNLRNAYCF